jgi:arsenite oxidase large subunit
MKTTFNVLFFLKRDKHKQNGTTRAIAIVTNTVRIGEVFGAFGFQNSIINDLCTDYVDPDTKIPFYKGTAANIVRIGRIESLIKDMTFQERV